MTRDDMIKLAREAGWEYANNYSGFDPLWKFGELVAAAERNRTWTQDHWTEYERSIAATEREACATVCDKETNPNTDKHEPVSQYQSGCYITAEYLATAIRARGQG
jgi:hypothetical protein